MQDGKPQTITNKRTDAKSSSVESWLVQPDPADWKRLPDHPLRSLPADAGLIKAFSDAKLQKIGQLLIGK
jgi:hypothetical protein